MSRVRDITKFLEETRKTNTNLKALRPSTTSTIDSAAVLVMKNASGMSVFSTLDSLPVTSLTTGQQAYVTENSRIYISNGNGWYNVAVVNATPALTLSASGTIALTAGSATTITMTATDSDNADANLALTLESGGDLFKFATVSQDSSVVTITPRTADSATALGSDGSATLTFKASDGVNQATVQNTFTISFGPDWSATPTETKITASDAAANDRFARSLAISGDGSYAISGAIYESAGGSNAGAAYIFVKSGGSWSQQQKIVASDAATEQWFGQSVAINSDGTYAVVGAFKHDLYGTDAGAAYVFTRSGSTWTQQQRIVGSTATASDNFGASVAINSDGTYIAVGAQTENSVFIFTRSGSTWSEQAKCQSSDGPYNTAFGLTVEINSDGTYFITGDSNKSGGGSAYVFTRSGTSWSQQAKLVSTDLQASDYFGYDVSLNSDATYAVVGSAFEDTGQSNAGSAYVFTRSGSTWTQQAKIQASDVTGSAFFGAGASMNSSGDHVIIGASGLNNRIGSVYIFERSGSTWTQKVKLRGSDATTTYSDGGSTNVSITSDGSSVIYGHYYQTVSSTAGVGAAYIFEV